MTGTDLRSARAKLKMTQVELAAALGVTQGYISQVERGGKPLAHPRLWGLALRQLAGGGER
jgi:transcriptional regulator with XRE-family HTH domain